MQEMNLIKRAYFTSHLTDPITSLDNNMREMVKKLIKTMLEKYLLHIKSPMIYNLYSFVLFFACGRFVTITFRKFINYNRNSTDARN